jgi:phage minor structural protein
LLTVTDIYGNTEMLTGYKGLKRFRSVSGEKTLAFLILPTDQNAHSFDMVQEESIVEFDGDTYRIKQMSEKNKGQKYFKEVVAIHSLFDLIDGYVYEVFTGSKTFLAALQFVFSGTPYTWSIVDTFLARDFENFGDDNRLSLFQKVLESYDAEFTLNGTYLTFKQKIGNATDFQFRYNYNVKTLNRQVNTNNLSTYIKGFGKKNEDGTYLIQSEYTSPNSTIFGIRHAKPVNDEQYTTLAGLNARLLSELKDTPEISITLDFVDLRRAGFPFDVPNEGDEIFLIYEPMNLDGEARIVDIAEEFSEFNDYPIKTDATLTNFRNNMTDAFIGFTQTGKTVDGIMDGSKTIPYNALDDAVKRATAALQSAQTELEFVNGIIARDKTNPNFLVLFNSNGIGISRDGGATFTEAITSDGFVLSAGAIGQLAANNIQIGAPTTFADGYSPADIDQSIKDDLRMTAPLPTSLTLSQDGIRATTSDPTSYAQMDYRGFFTKKGAFEVERPDGYVTIMDGIPQYDFGIMGAHPPFMSSGVMVEGYWLKCSTSALQDCQFYTYKHTSRYLKVQVGLYAGSVASGARISVMDSLTTLVSRTTYDTNDQSDLAIKGEILTVDLGVPTGDMKYIYVRLNSGADGSDAYGRVLTIWKEG